MEPLASPIQIPIVASPIVTTLIYGGHAVIMVILITAFPLSIRSVIAVCCVCVSLAVQSASQVDLAASVDAILLRSNGQWSIVTRRGEVLAARLARSAFISPWLVILFLKSRGRRTAHIVLTCDNTNRDALRRLRVRLRVPM